jgi:hypothetical protein
MLVRQLTLSDPAQMQAALKPLSAPVPQWVLVFAAPAWFRQPRFFPALRNAFPSARLSGCSTAGEIGKDGVTSGTCVVTTVSWAGPPPAQAVAEIATMADSLGAGMRLGRELPPSSAVLVFAPGVNINGSALVEGLASGLPSGTRIMGGLAGDDGAFTETYTLGDAGIFSHAVVALALPPGFRIGHGSFGGWKPFGPARKVSRSSGNVLYELDGEPALEVYERCLGDHARNLPASGLLFPFEMLGADHSAIGLIRTILGIDEAAGSLILAGDIDPRGYLRLMQASTDALVSGAETAAAATRATLSVAPDAGLAILVSCVGRKLVMGGRVGEEVDAVAEVLGHDVTMTGFYSYGEISPFFPGNECKLHNQTMTITCLTEF